MCTRYREAYDDKTKRLEADAQCVASLVAASHVHMLPLCSGLTPLCSGLTAVTLWPPVESEHHVWPVLTVCICRLVFARAQVSVNGRRLKEGPYTTLMRPARLDPAKSVLLGQGVRGASPGEEEVLLLQLVNELSENMTTCSTSGEQVVGTTVEIACSGLRADACQTRSDCEWLPVDAAVGAGVCNTVRQRELVEIFLEPIVSVEEDSGVMSEDSGVMSASEPSLEALPQLEPAASGAGVSGSVPESAEVTSGEQEKRAGTVKSCDHGTYTLSYTMADAGRYRLFVKVAGQNSGVSSASSSSPCWLRMLLSDLCWLKL